MSHIKHCLLSVPGSFCFQKQPPLSAGWNRWSEFFTILEILDILLLPLSGQYLLPTPAFGCDSVFLLWPMECGMDSAQDQGFSLNKF